MKPSQKKSRIRETPTLSTDAVSRTDTNFKRLRDLTLKKKYIYKLRDKKNKIKNKNYNYINHATS